MNIITSTYEGSPAEPVSGSTLLRHRRDNEPAHTLSSLENAAIDKSISLRSDHG